MSDVRKSEQRGKLFWNMEAVLVHGYLRFCPGSFRGRLSVDYELIISSIFFKFIHSLIMRFDCLDADFSWIFIQFKGSVGFTFMDKISHNEDTHT